MAELFTLVGKIAIDATVANQTIDNTMSLVGDLNVALQGTSDHSNTASRALGSRSGWNAAAVWFGNMATKLTTAAFNMGKAFVVSGFEFNTSMEEYTAAFKTLLGVDWATAEAYVEKLRLFAQETPLGMQGITSGAVSLLNAGFNSEEVIDTLSFLGDVALGDQDRLDRIVRAYTQVKSFGKLRAQEAYQFLDADVPLYSILAEYLKVDQSQIAGLQKDGKITFDVFDAALRSAAADEGMYYRAMENYMLTFAGQQEKIGDIADQTKGAITAPFFDVLKSDVMPKFVELLEKTYTWVTENSDSISGFAEALGQFATGGMDALIRGLEWMTENDVSIANAFDVIATGVTAALSAFHPFIAAITMGIALFDDIAKMVGTYEEPERTDTSFQSWLQSKYGYNVFRDSDYEQLQEYVEAKKRYEAAVSGADIMNSPKYLEKMNSVSQSSDWMVSTLVANYEQWAEQTNLDPYNIVVEVDESSEGTMQSQIDGMNLEATVDVNANLAPYYNAISSIRSNILQGALQGVGRMFYSVPDGTHAKGLDFVPRDGYLARLHYGEAVLNRSTADMLRGGGMGNTSRVEALLQDVLSGIRQIAGNTSTGQTLALDTGVLVGQITPMIDRRLGTISNRKGRG